MTTETTFRFVNDVILL